MNLKLVVATMIVAGAVSANAFADQNVQAEMDAMKAQLAQIQASMNANNAGTNLPATGWFNRISLSGFMNVDAMAARDYSPVDFTAAKNPSTIAISSAGLYADADVSDWTKAHIGIVYSTVGATQFNSLIPGVYTASEISGSNAHLALDEAYATIANFAKSPFYLKAGKQYLPFGSYTPFADITPSLTQVLSQVNDPAVVAGFVTNNGFSGSIYALQGIGKIQADGPSRSTVDNGGVSLALNNTYGNVSYNVGVGYLSNMADVTGVNYQITGTEDGGTVAGYNDRVGGIAANLGVKYSSFDLSGKWVGAMKQFNADDVWYTTDGGTTMQGAKPQAWGVDAGYSFPVLAHGSRFGLGYQGSKQAELGLGFNTTPRSRYLADYSVNVSKYTDLGFELRHDIDYAVSNGGTGYSTNTAAARLAVKFA